MGKRLEIRRNPLEYYIKNYVKVDPTTGCWLWQGWINPTKGYGQIRWKGKHHNAHRLIHHLAKGSDLHDGLMRLHECDNARCVNPDHVKVGTQKENIVDSVQKGRWKRLHPIKTHCKNGHEMIPSNLYIYPDGRRQCLKCRLIYNVAYAESKKELDRLLYRTN